MESKRVVDCDFFMLHLSYPGVEPLYGRISYGIVFAVSILITSCSADKDIKKSSDKPFVLSTFTVLADMAENVAGDRLTIKSITKLGAEIHGYQPTPSDLVKASKVFSDGSMISSVLL